MSNDNTAGDWLTAAELAEAMEVHVETIRAWAREGLVEVRPLPRRGRRYRQWPAQIRETVQDGAA